MRHAFALESIESRTLLSASVKTIGPSAGLSPQATGPTFTDAVGTVQGGAVDDSNSGIDRDSSIKVHIDVNGTGTIDGNHLHRASVKVVDTDTGHTYTTDELSKVITSGGGDVVIVSFKDLLPQKNHFTIELNFSGVKADDKIRTSDGTTTSYFPDQKFQFSTGTYYAQSSLTSGFKDYATTAGDHGYTSVTVGPDGKLYAADTQGNIYSFPINSDGSLGTATVNTAIRDHFGGGNRLITGISFKPNSTADSMEMWVSSGQYRFGNHSDSSDAQKSADNFTGEIDGLSGPGLTNVEPLVIHIPRSVKDHTNNQITFSPNSKSAFFGIAAMNAMGKADSTWGNRVENIYSATIMTLKVGGTNGIYGYIHAHGGPVDLMIDGDQDAADGLTPGTLHYNVFKGTNPLRIYADGIRNDYDMVFATDGHIYAAINGSSAGGNVPATPSDLSTVPIANRPDKDAVDSHGNYIYHTDPKDRDSPLKPYTGPTSSGLSDVRTVEEDTLLDVKNGAYYGHPNAARGEYILDGGNPTANGKNSAGKDTGVDPYEIAGASGYAAGQSSDRSYTQPVYDFGQDYSPDGMFQYKSVGGKNQDLDGYLLVCRYSSGADILALQPKNGKIGLTQARIPGFTALGTPLDVTEDPNTGNLYVAVLTDELGHGSILLMKPQTASASSKKKAVKAAAVHTAVAVEETAAPATPVTRTSTATAFSSKPLIDDLDLDA